MKKKEEYLERIVNYIFEPRFTRALLIDGDWGCGKSYFVKNDLISKIERTQPDVSEKAFLESENASFDKYEANNKQREYKAIYISLYGIGSISDLQENIFLTSAERGLSNSDSEIFKTICNNGVLFGSTILRGLGSYFNVADDSKKFEFDICEKVLARKKDDIVLIFDDFERCRINIIELMGYLNNLSENKGYRVIIVANEKEVEKQENEIASAIRTNTSLLGTCIKEYIKKEDNILSNDDNQTENELSKVLNSLSNNENNVKEKSFMKEVQRTRNSLFLKNNSYERTREKLIGMTIHLKVDIREVYDDILEKYVKGKNKDYLLEIKVKETVIKCFNDRECSNLRILISVFLASEKILDCINVSIKENELTKDEIESIIKEEKLKLIHCISNTAITYAGGSSLIDLKGSRYENVVGYDSRNKGIIYEFVNSYWENLIVDELIVNTDFNDRIEECIYNRVKLNKDANHKDLALFKLFDWYNQHDKDVIINIQKMKDELKSKQYYANEFKDIIQLLVCINDKYYGMMPSSKDYESMNSGVIYNSLDYEMTQRTIRNEENSKDEEGSNVSLENLNYVPWEKENIDEYVEYMLDYFEDPNFCITKEMLRLLFQDKKFVIEYNKIIQPLLDKIEEKECEKLQKENDGIYIFDEWDDSLCESLRKNRNKYFEKHQFISLFSCERIEKKLSNSSPLEISTFRDAIHIIYSFSNLRDFFDRDYSVVNALWQSLYSDRKNGRGKYNVEKSRTKEIALCGLENDLKKYRDALSDPYKDLEERINE